MQTPAPSPKSVTNLSVNWTPAEFARSMSARTHKRCQSVQIYSLIYLGPDHIVLQSQPNPRNRFSPKLSLPVHEAFVPANDDTRTIGELANLTALRQMSVPSVPAGEYAGHCVSVDQDGYNIAVVAIIFRVVDQRAITKVRDLVREDKEDWGYRYVGPEMVTKQQVERMGDMGFGKLKKGVLVGFDFKGSH